MKKLLAIVALAAAVGLALWGIGEVGQAQGTTPNVAVGAGDVVVIPLHISGQYTATTAGVAKFTLPFEANVLGVSATARASGGTSPTLTIDVKEGGTTILSAPVSITAGTVAEGTVTDALLADESTMTVDFTIGGTSPTWNDMTVLVTLVRR